MFAGQLYFFCRCFFNGSLNDQIPEGFFMFFPKYGPGASEEMVLNLWGSTH